MKENLGSAIDAALPEGDSVTVPDSWQAVEEAGLIGKIPGMDNPDKGPMPHTDGRIPPLANKSAGVHKGRVVDQPLMVDEARLDQLLGPGEFSDTEQQGIGQASNRVEVMSQAAFIWPTGATQQQQGERVNPLEAKAADGSVCVCRGEDEAGKPIWELIKPEEPGEEIIEVE